MKTTVDIPEKLLKEAMRRSKATTKREAVVAALEEYNRRRQVEEMLSRMGKSDTFMTQAELMDMRMQRGKYRDPR
jgi:Arc/MetJ family transcription regulator